MLLGYERFEQRLHSICFVVYVFINIFLCNMHMYMHVKLNINLKQLLILAIISKLLLIYWIESLRSSPLIVIGLEILPYVPTQEGWVYLATVIDLFSRKIIGWSMNSNMKNSNMSNSNMMNKNSANASPTKTP